MKKKRTNIQSFWSQALLQRNIFINSFTFIMTYRKNMSRQLKLGAQHRSLVHCKCKKDSTKGAQRFPRMAGSKEYQEKQQTPCNSRAPELSPVQEVSLVEPR